MPHDASTHPLRPARRFVVTGLGAVSAWGWSAGDLWRGLLSGRTAIGSLDRFPAAEQRTRLAAQVPAPPRDLPARVAGWNELSQAERFALVATLEAVGAAGLAPGDLPAPHRTGVFFGGSTAGMFETEETIRALLVGDRAGATRTDLAPLTSQPLDNPAGAVARLLGAAGPVVTVSSACASGTQAVGLALDALRAGEVDVAVTGGADSLCRLTYAGFNALRVVDAEACRPFREGRTGMSLGEGAGILIIEPLERAVARGAAILGSCLGVGNSCDAHHMTAPRPDGLGAALATERALADAGVTADEVAFLNAHGTGTPLNDASEWRGFARALGPRAAEIPLTATKASIGHLLGTSGSLEAVATVLCLDAGLVHPTPGGGTIDPETPARLVRGEPLPIERPGVALSTSFGFGGANAAAAFGPARFAAGSARGALGTEVA